MTLAAETSYVRQGRALFPALFPNGDFDSPIWDVRHLRTSRHKTSNSRLHFTRYGSETDGLPPRFANVVKAYLMLSRCAAGTMSYRVDIARMFWEAIASRFGDSHGFDWSLLTEEDLLKTEQVMLAHWSPSTTYKRSTQLQFMMRSLAAAPGGGIVRPMEVIFTTPRTDDSERYTLDGQLERMKRLPSDGAIQAVGDIYAKYAREPRDRLIACVLAVMLATAFRIGEALTLPLDCLCSEGTGTRKRWGIRYHKEKSRGGRKQLAVRWMTPKQAELARTAIQEAKKLTLAARKRARQLEARPDRVTLPGITGNRLLRREEVAKLLRIAPTSVNRLPLSELAREAIRIPGRESARYEYRAAYVRSYLLRLRVPALWVVDRRDGTRQSLSKSLFIAFRNFFNEHLETNPLLVEPVLEQTVNDFLGRRTALGTVTRSAFVRFGLRDEEGQFFRLHSHQFRHWVTTKAAVAGVPDEVIARWQGREHLGDLEAYKHLTPSEQINTLKSALQSGRTRGAVADIYFNLHDDVRDAFLEAQLQAVHVTPLGLCVHDFKVSPCPKMLNCVKDCDDYLFDTANTTHRQNLVQLQARTKLTLENAEAQRSRGEADLSEHWIADAEATLAGVDRILSAIPSDGETLVRPHVGKGVEVQTSQGALNMPRPSMEEEVRDAVRVYLAAAVAKSPEDAPLHVLAVAKQTGFDRKTLKKYGLDMEIAAAAEEQAKGSELSPREVHRRTQADALHDRDQEIAALRQRCESLVARICIAEGNAQRLGIDPVELWKPLMMPNRSVSHAGTKQRGQGSWRTLAR